MRLNGHGTLTLEDARTWIEETGLCLFLPRRQFSSFVAPSFVEAVAGHRNPTPDPKHVTLAEELLVRLELDGVAVRLNLLGQPGEHPDFVVAAWVLPYVYALRGDRDWRRNPQLTGSRQVSQLAVQAYKLLEAGDTTIPSLKLALGREVTETAVLRAITELWQQLRIIPVIAAPGQTAKWQLLRTRFQKAIAEGASTSQVTAISVLASIYLQAVIAASMEEVELFLAPLTARSKIREVLRGLVATRQVHTIQLGHAPHFYVAGTLPEFAVPATIYASSSMPASAYFLHSHEHEHDHEEEHHDHAVPLPIQASPEPALPLKSPEARAPRISTPHKQAAASKPSAPRPRFTRPAVHARDRKPGQTSSGSRVPAGRTAGSRTSSARPASARWKSSGSANASRNGSHGVSGTGNGTRSNGARANGVHSNGNGNGLNHGSKVSPGARSTKSASLGQRKGKPIANSGAGTRSGSLLRGASAPRKDARPDARTSSRNGRKPALTASAKAGNSKRFGFTAPRKPSPKKRG